MSAPKRLYVDRVSAENATRVLAAFVEKERLGLPDGEVETYVSADLHKAAVDELRYLLDLAPDKLMRDRIEGALIDAGEAISSASCELCGMPLTHVATCSTDSCPNQEEPR